MDIQTILALIAALTGTPDHRPAPAADALRTAGVTLTSCPRPLPPDEVEGRTIQCGTVRVPEDHAQPDGKQLDLFFAILKAQTMFPEPDPVVYLQGGPGGSAVAHIPLFERVFRPWRPRRDIVIFDQRSAGLSGSSVNCYKALSENQYDLLAPAAEKTSDVADTRIVTECAAELKASGINLSLYNTTQNAQDVQTVVKALGYGPYNIYGISYGTKLALEVMRVAPENLRSVIIDGVAPSWVHLYNSFALKTDEAIQTVVDQCAADPVCDSAFPDLGRIVTEVLNKAAAGGLTVRGQTVPVALVVAPFNARNGQYDSSSITRYIPAYVYELHRGREMPTVEMLLDAGLKQPKPGEPEVLAAAAKLTPEQRALVARLLDDVAITNRAATSAAALVEDLRASVENSTTFGPMAGLFDQELGRAMLALLQADKTLLKTIIADYVALQSAPPSRQALADFVTRHLQGEAQARLTSIIAAMSPAEIDASFTIIRRDSYAAQQGFLSGLYLDIYACQEDIPFNTLDGYKAATASARYPHLGTLYDGLADMFFASCAAFDPKPRANWNVPVASDIPILSFGSLYDIQTPASWAKIATEQMTHAQVFMIPEAGHGAVIYQPCVADMGVAFFDDPSRQFDDSCPASISIDWFKPGWVAAK
ncbi:TAP-like protein [Gemmobacter aquatilis]|uniref:Proline iminopeptidase n=1 Tax=Gemmobacter aquatilis TaxID=933059 RepID=A0A1H8JX67_9RHOB|nr:alpha/beta fold hydrolase [Gemmobacter aquatilis]SEN85292.1 TAP-like protein [Gemmobacter aquatilis]